MLQKEIVMEKNTESIFIRLPNKLYSELIDMADKKNISISALVRMAITEYLEQNK